MYLPTRFHNKDRMAALEVIQNHPLATLISTDEGCDPFISHVPLYFEERGQELVLCGHLSRANPHCRLLASRPVTIVFHGPEGYISPEWYLKNDVPTWNYVVVHARGVAKLVEDYDGIVAKLEKLSAHAKTFFGDEWTFWIPDDLSGAGVLQKSIVAFEIEVESLHAKFKLNQNRDVDDRRRVIERLRERGRARDAELALAMEESLQQDGAQL